MGKDFDAKSALADIMSEVKKQPKRGRKKGSRNNVKVTYALETDSVRLMLMEEIEKIYREEGYEWLLQENPRERYSTEQLRIHVQRLREGHRAWKMPVGWK